MIALSPRVLVSCCTTIDLKITLATGLDWSPHMKANPLIGPVLKTQQQHAATIAGGA